MREVWANYGLPDDPDIEYVIERRGDAYYLYSTVQTTFGGVAKNLIRMASTERELQKTIQNLQKNS